MFKKLKTLTRFSRIMLYICIGIMLTCITLLSLSPVLDTGEQMISTLVFNLIQSTLMVILILVPLFFRKATHLVIPWSIEVIYVVFCSLCLILGEIGEFYNKISWWDSMLHTLSGVLIGALGYITINTIDNSNNNEIKLRPIFASVFVLIFVMAVGYVWEIIEFSIDGIFGSNMQRYLVDGSPTVGGGEALVGRAALSDTMKDLILNLIGGSVVAIYGFFQMKHDKKGLTTLSLVSIDNISVEDNRINFAKTILQKYNVDTTNLTNDEIQAIIRNIKCLE